MDWDDLRYFLALHRSGSLAAGARALGVNSTTVGRRLTVLEEKLGSRLFDRTPDGFVLTSAGQSIIGAVESIEERVLEIERRAGGGDEKVEGSVRIAVADFFFIGYLAPRLRELREHLPGVHFDMVVGQATANLERREADISLRPRLPGVSIATPDLIAIKVGEIAISMYGSLEYLARHGRPEPDGSLSGHNLVTFGEDSPGFPGKAWLGDDLRGATCAVSATSFMTVLAGATAGLGLAVVPCFLGDADPRLERVAGTVDEMTLWLAVHPDLLRVAKVRAAKVLLCEIIRRDSSVLRGETRRPATAQGDRAD